jgi:hypothetical protein
MDIKLQACIRLPWNPVTRGAHSFAIPKKFVVAIFHKGRSEPNFAGAGQSYLSLIGTAYAYAPILAKSTQ